MGSAPGFSRCPVHGAQGPADPCSAARIVPAILGPGPARLGPARPGSASLGSARPPAPAASLFAAAAASPSAPPPARPQAPPPRRHRLAAHKPHPSHPPRPQAPPPHRHWPAARRPRLHRRSPCPRAVIGRSPIGPALNKPRSLPLHCHWSFYLLVAPLGSGRTLSLFGHFFPVDRGGWHPHLACSLLALRPMRLLAGFGRYTFPRRNLPGTQ